MADEAPNAPCSGWEPAVQLRHDAEALGGWLPPLMVVVADRYAATLSGFSDHAGGTQGSLCLATLGFATASRWDSRVRVGGTRFL